MKIVKLLTAGLLVTLTFGFTSNEELKIQLNGSNIELAINEFELNKKRVILNTKNDEILYVEIGRKKTNGKKYVNHKRIKRSGATYILQLKRSKGKWRS